MPAPVQEPVMPHTLSQPPHIADSGNLINGVNEHIQPSGKFLFFLPINAAGPLKFTLPGSDAV